MEESKDCYVDVYVLFRRRRKTEKEKIWRRIFGEGKYFVRGGEEKRRRKRRTKFGEGRSDDGQMYKQIFLLWTRPIPQRGRPQLWRGPVKIWNKSCVLLSNLLFQLCFTRTTLHWLSTNQWTVKLPDSAPITHICQFWVTTTLFRPVNGAPVPKIVTK